MLLRGKPVPEELQPLGVQVFQEFLNELYDEQAYAHVNELSKRYSPDWSYLTQDQQIKFFSDISSLIFHQFTPLPTIKVNPVRNASYTAVFNPQEWSISFFANHLQNRSFHASTKTLLHEQFHGFLHFLSLRLRDRPRALKAISLFDETDDPSAQMRKDPRQINNFYKLREIHQIAQSNPIPPTQKAAELIAERNLLGMTDRYLGQTERYFYGLDSYYLNVEIIVENLAVMLFQQLYPNAPIRRSYRTAEEYINIRLSGRPAIEAYSYN